MEHENQQYLNIYTLLTEYFSEFVRYYWLFRYLDPPPLKPNIVFNSLKMIQEFIMFNSTITWKIELFRPHLFKLLFILMRLSISSLWEETTKSNIRKKGGKTLPRVKGRFTLKYLWALRNRTWASMLIICETLFTLQNVPQMPCCQRSLSWPISWSLSYVWTSWSM